MLCNKVDYLIRDNRIAQALELLDRNRELYKGSNYRYCKYLYKRGDTLQKMGRYEDALIFFEKALELSPSNINYQYMHAQTLAEMGRIKEASQSAEKVLTKNKSHARARIIVADYLRLSGKLNEALSHYEIAAKTLEIKTYAEYFIEEVKRQIEEQEIEEKWNNFQKHQ